MKEGNSASTSLEQFRLDGQVAVVTGGAGLYGTPISRALAQAGATVVVASRTLANCEERAAELRAEGLDCHAETFDQGDVESIRALHDRVSDTHGTPNILVNNALYRSPTHYDEATPEQWAAALQANCAGVHFCTLVFAEGMRAAKQGAIINIASIYGVVAPDFRIYEGEDFASPPDYPFHKGGMIAYTRYCASLFAPEGVRVNCISPGGYASGQSDRFTERYNDRVPLGRMAADADITGPVVFLASDAARYITGINLVVDGGLTIR
jgi:NAD(P)-dependent dehydrogenase (short-subunit alcohol dehydrogenase family)